VLVLCRSVWVSKLITSSYSHPGAPACPLPLYSATNQGVCLDSFAFPCLQLGLTFESCRNPSLGLATKARCDKVVDQEGDPRVTSHAPESAKSVREWTLTLPSELPCWELESQKDSRVFRVQFQGSKFLASRSY
jgi:hypothetical protein